MIQAHCKFSKFSNINVEKYLPKIGEALAMSYAFIHNIWMPSKTKTVDPICEQHNVYKNQYTQPKS